MTQKTQCSHIRDGHNAATVRVTMKAIEGALTRAVDLDTETELCTLCAARITSALMLLEKDGGWGARDRLRETVLAHDFEKDGH
jgi:hypothetical protein